MVVKHVSRQAVARSQRRRARIGAPHASFDDFVGAGEDRWRDREAERLGCVEVDDQLECRRLLDRQIGGLGALEDPSGVNALQVIDGRKARGP